MLVKEIIKKVCHFIENDELLIALDSEGEMDEENQKLLDKLIHCFNLVHDEIVGEYIKVVKKEKCQVTAGKISFDALSNKVIAVLAVKDKNGEDVKFDVYENEIYVNEDFAEVYYYAAAQKLTIEDEFDTVLPERVYAYGVTREYYFIQTLYEDAKIWDERFTASLENYARKKGDTVLPRRRWV